MSEYLNHYEGNILPHLFIQLQFELENERLSFRKPFIISKNDNTDLAYCAHKKKLELYQLNCSKLKFEVSKTTQHLIWQISSETK